MSYPPISSHILCMERDHALVFDSVEHLSADWKKIGIRLGVTFDRIKIIDKNEDNLDDKLMELLAVWLKIETEHQPKPTWRKLNEVVRTINIASAKKMAQEHQCDCSECLDESLRSEETSSKLPVKLPAVASVVSNPNATKQGMALSDHNSDTSLPENISTTSSTSSVTSDKSNVYRVPDSVVRKVIELSCLYTDLVAKIIEHLRKKVLSKEIDFCMLARKINLFRRIEHLPLQGNETVDDLFNPITQRLSCFEPNIGLLVCINRNVCKNEFELMIDEYHAAFKSFKKSTTIKHFARALKSVVMIQQNEARTSDSRVIMKISPEYGNETIDLFQKLKDNVFDKYSSVMALVDVQQSVLTISYSIPSNFVGISLLGTVLKKIGLLKLAGILSIQIGNVLLPIADEKNIPSVSDDRRHVLDLHQKNKAIRRKRAQNVQLREKLSALHQTVVMLQKKVQSGVLTDPVDTCSDGQSTVNAREVSELQSEIQNIVSEEEGAALYTEFRNKFPLIDQPAEGMLSIKPDWDKQTDITSGYVSMKPDSDRKTDASGDVQESRLVMEGEMKEKDVVELEQRKGVQIERELREKVADLEQTNAQLKERVLYKELHVKQEDFGPYQVQNILRERQKIIDRMREEIKRLHQSIKGI